MNNESSKPAAGERESAFDFVGAIALLLGYRKWIATCTVSAGVLGVLYALLASPVYTSGAVLALKERDMGDGASRLFSQFGSLGGGGGNTGLAKMAILLESHDLSVRVVRDNDLLPVLFPKQWDADAKTWKAKYRHNPPGLVEGARLLKSRLSTNVQTRNAVLNFSVQAPSASQAKRLALMYLEALRYRLRESVMASAEADRRYLEAQLDATADPVLREKIQSMIVLQIEKSMLVSSQGFEVLEEPIEPRLRTAPQRRKIVQTALLAGFVLSVLGVYGWRGFKALKQGLRDRAAGKGMENAT